MRLDQHEDRLEIHTDSYHLVFDRPRLLVRLYSPDRRLYYHMSMISAVDTTAAPDTTTAVEAVRVVERSPRIVVEIVLASRLWKEKVAVYTCEESLISCHLRVSGSGQIDRAYFFRGGFRDSQLASVPGFDLVWPACPNFLEKEYFHASEYASINAGHETFAWGYALASGPLCFALGNGPGTPWLSAGLAPAPDQWSFQSYEFNHKPPAVAAELDSIIGTQAFSISYYGHQEVSGRWETPRLVLQFADERSEAVRAYVDRLYASGLLSRREAVRPAWWSRPIFCGWHEQFGLPFPRDGASLTQRYLEAGRKAPAACTQANYQRWLDRLEQKRCKPGTIIIDALWQVAPDVNEVDTGKWPDMRGFIDACHANDQRVVLWIDLWKRRQLPDEECATIDGKPVCADPTNPLYVQRLRSEIRSMLSDAPGCLNADGFKIDGQTVQPYGYGMKTQGGLYGFALQKTVLQLIHGEAKRQKPDALIGLFSANPYFADVCDMVRLGDMYTVKGDPIGTLRKRAEIVRLGMPGKPIDTDGLFHFNLERSVPELIAEQARLGIPTLYTAEEVLACRTFAEPEFRALTDEDYAAISRVFAEAWRRSGHADDPASQRNAPG